VEPRIGPLATAYVLILVVVGPLTARWTEPLARKLTGRPETPVETERTAPEPAKV
ncbi:cation:proton antiporter, partial [Streptomyces sp. NPDC057062]